MPEVIPCVTMQRIPSGTPLRGCICYSGWSQGCVPCPGLMSGTPIRGWLQIRVHIQIYPLRYIIGVVLHIRMGVLDTSPGQGTEPWDHPEWHMPLFAIDPSLRLRSDLGCVCVLRALCMVCEAIEELSYIFLQNF